MDPKPRLARSRSPLGVFVAGLASIAVALLSTTCAPVSLLEAADQRLQRPSELGVSGESPAHSIDHVVIVAIDGVRWQEVFLGIDAKRAPLKVGEGERLPDEVMPELHRIARTNGMLLGGDDSKVSVSSPSTVSLPGYSELFSGRTPKCSNNDCGPTDETTLLDDWHRSDPSATMALVSSWSRIPRVAAKHPGHLAITAGRSQAQNLEGSTRDAEFAAAVAAGRHAAAVPGTDDYRPDRYTAAVALRLLEQQRPQFLFLGLGDTDEYAHLGDYTGYLKALKEADAVVGRLDNWLSMQRREGKRTLLIVTADHGRAASFQNHGFAKEAARIWMLWSGEGVTARGYPPSDDSRLADLAPTLRLLLRLPPDQDPRAGHALGAALGPSSNPLVASRLSFVALRR